MSFSIQQGLFQYKITDHYAILGIPLDADGEMIRKQYLKIARQLHPDTCKFKTEGEKRLASQIFSQLVAPANKQLSNESLRIEYLLVLVQTGQRIAQDTNAVTITSDIAQKLFQASGSKLNVEYNNLLKTVSENQYKNIEEVIEKIGQLSEINLVYVMQKQGQDITWKPKAQVTVTAEEANRQTQTPAAKETVPDSPTMIYLRRAEDYIEKNLPSQAMIELRDVLKIDPNDSSAHALMGLAYLKQNQLTMAKVHINKAIQSNAQDPIVIKAKIALDKVIKVTEGPKKENEKGGGIFKNLFGGKKN